MDKLKSITHVFELPKKLGIVQEVIYEKPSYDKCPDGENCPYEGVLVAEGCRKGVCVRYRVRVISFDRRSWITEGFRRERVKWGGGCIPPAVADALWELAGCYDVGLWYEYRYLSPCIGCDMGPLYKRECGLIVNGVRITMPYCRTATDCVEQILEYYRREVERMKEPPPPHQLSSQKAEELLKKYPELEAFGVEWVRKWAPHARERLVEIAETLRRYPWMIEVIKKRPLDNLNPYTVEVYAAKDGSVVCLSFQQRAYCAQNGSVKAIKLELEFIRYETYGGKRRAVYRPKGLLTFTAMGKEYAKIL